MSFFFWSEGRGLHIWSVLFTAKRRARDIDINARPRTALDKESGIGVRDVDSTVFSASKAGHLEPISAALILGERGRPYSWPDTGSNLISYAWWQSTLLQHGSPRTRLTETWAVRFTKHSGVREVLKDSLYVRSPETRWNRESPLSLACVVSEEGLPHVGASCFYASREWEA